MYREFVKIVDLKEDNDISSFNDKDLYLKSSILSEDFSADGITGNAYKSNSFSTLSIINDVFTKPRVVTNRWEFSIPGTPPTVSVTIDPTRYNTEILMNTDNRRDAIVLSGGNYTRKTETGYDAISSSLSVSQYTIANLDYANRLAAWIYEDIINRLDEIITIQKKKTFVGQIIHSTIFNTETAVRNFYGNDTRWIQHVGYTLRGANSNSAVISGNAGKSKTGGDNNNRTMPLINHTHTVYHKHDFSVSKDPSNANAIVFTDLKWKDIKSVTSHGGGTHPLWSVEFNSKTEETKNSIGTGSYTIELNRKSLNDPSLDIRQPFKKVYIWERIS